MLLSLNQNTHYTKKKGSILKGLLCICRCAMHVTIIQPEHPLHKEEREYPKGSLVYLSLCYACYYHSTRTPITQRRKGLSLRVSCVFVYSYSLSLAISYSFHGFGSIALTFDLLVDFFGIQSSLTPPH